MTLDEETLTLGDELHRLDEQADEYAEQIRDADDQTVARIVRSDANDVEQAGAAVAYLIDEYDADATVTIRGLTAGDQAQLLDRIAAKRESMGQDSLPGYRRNVFAAGGLVDAPFVDSDADLETRIQAVADQPPGVAVWLQTLVNQKTTLDQGNWTPLGERLLATPSN